MVCTDDRPGSAMPDIRSPHHPPPAKEDVARRAKATSKFSAFTACLPFLMLLIMACLPTASAHPVDHRQYDSSPSTRQRQHPILSTLQAAVEWALHSVATASGYDVVPQAEHGIVKRGEVPHKKIAMAIMIPFLVLISGMFAGLTLAYFSVDPTQLQVLSMSGTPRQKTCARMIMPVRKDSHLLLTTLILGNMIVNEALPIVVDEVVGGGWAAIIIATALVVVFAEIIPQSICSRHGLLIGASMAPAVRILIWFFFPIGWPVAKLLELILGPHHGIIYRRKELRALIKLHGADNGKGGDLDLDTVTMAQGALNLAKKKAKHAMTPIDNVFMLSIDTTLDYYTLDLVVRSGHSRIPVYKMVETPDIDFSQPIAGPPQTKWIRKIIGCMLVKSCVLLDPDDATPLANMPINSLPTVPYDEPLTSMLNAFQEGRSHMAIVSRRARVVKEEEDVPSVMGAAAGGLRQRLMRTVRGRGNSDTAETPVNDADIELAVREPSRKPSECTVLSSEGTVVAAPDNTKDASGKGKGKDTSDEGVAKPKHKRSFSAAVDAARLNQRDQSIPADAALPDEQLEQFIEGLEGQPLGIITLEDVLEQLIGEEIYDEYDEQGGNCGDISTFVTPEAARAARQAAIGRARGHTSTAGEPIPSNPPGYYAEADAKTESVSRRSVMSTIRPIFTLKSRSPSPCPPEEGSDYQTPTEKRSPIDQRAPDLPHALETRNDTVLPERARNASHPPTPIDVSGSHTHMSLQNVPTSLAIGPAYLLNETLEKERNRLTPSPTSPTSPVSLTAGRLTPTPADRLTPSPTVGISALPASRSRTPPVSEVSPTAKEASEGAAETGESSSKRTPAFKLTPVSRPGTPAPLTIRIPTPAAVDSAPAKEEDQDVTGEEGRPRAL